MYAHEVHKLSFGETSLVLEEVRHWYIEAASKTGPEEELARERLFAEMKKVFSGRSIGGVLSSHDPDGSAQHAWEQRRDVLVREVALIYPWKTKRAVDPAFLRGGHMVARAHQVKAWTDALEHIGLDWTDIDQLARKMAQQNDEQWLHDRNAVAAIVARCASGQGIVRNEKKLAKKLGVSWEAIMKKARFSTDLGLGL